MTVALPRRGRDQSRLNLIDYALMGLGSGLAAYTAGMAIGRDDTAQYLATGVLLGTVLSYFVRTLLGNTPFVKVDGILYAAAIGCAIVGFPVLNGFLPEDGFSRDVMMAGILAFMLVLGSVVTWRDGTLLFQAIPSVALFGLVGCYDTYAYAPYLFFGFLVCLAMVLARANRREMMRQAVESGYFNRADAPSAPGEFPEQSAELYEDIRRGPWRWLAGPEWALISALVIVLLSRLGAPAIQEAARPITSQFRILAPAAVRSRYGPQANTAQPTSYEVGRGPHSPLSEHVVYVATLDRPRYLRTASYTVYTGRGWSAGASLNTVQPAILAIGKARNEVKFSIQATDPTRQLPLPGEPLLVGAGGQLRPDGGGTLTGNPGQFVNGTLVEATATPSRVPTVTDELGPEVRSGAGVTPRVRDFAAQAIAGSRDSFDAASRIAAAIANQTRYNINAAAVPRDADPAEWFLFTNREGYCDLFATAMTLCARSAGLPARYVIGYLPEPRLSDGAGNYALREADYHAWCEIFFEGAGWVVFDATSGAEQVEGEGRGSSDANRPWYTSVWITWTARGVLVAMALGFVVYLVRGIRPKVRPPRWEVHRAYARYERTLRNALGRRRHPGETVESYASASREAVGEGAIALGHRFARALYGPAEPTEDEIKGLREATGALRKR